MEYEHETPDLDRLVRIERETEADCWLRGYASGFRDGDVQLPASHQLAYMRGYVEGLRAKYRRR